MSSSIPIGLKLKEIRVARGLSQNEVVEDLLEKMLI